MKPSKTGFFLLAGMAVIISSCAPVQLVSNYDETIDKETQQLQKKIDGHFTFMRSSAGAEDLKYKNQKKFYEEVLVDLNAIRIRSGGIYNNNLTAEQVDLAKENLAYLVLLHKKCVTSPLTTEQKDRVKENGIDLSMDCKTDHGASADALGRGEEVISQSLLAPVQSLFNQQLGAVMALELAKKRGETAH